MAKNWENTSWLQKLRSFLVGCLALAAIIFCICIVTSCMTNRKGELTEKGINFIAQHCKGEDSTSHSDKITITHDTVEIAYPVAGPVQYLENPCKDLCDSLGNLKPFFITKKTNGITGTIRSVGNSMAFDCKTDSLRYIIEKQKQVIDNFEKSKIVIQEPCKKEHRTKWDGFTYWWFWITVGLLALVIFRLVLAGKIKIPFIK